MNNTDTKKVIIVTGASSGIGKETALKLIQQNHVVYGAARSIEKMKDLENAGGHSAYLDVTDAQSIEELVSAVINNEGRIDVLVNNAGYGLYGSVEDVSLEDAKYQFDVNVFGLGEMIQKVLPQMRKQQSGTIVNISSIAGKIYMPLGGWYHASKFAVEGLSDCLRTEVKDFNIKVVLIEPGAIATHFGNTMIPKLKEISEGGAYETQAKQVSKLMSSTSEDGSGLKPEKVVDKIITAITSKNPRHRYIIGTNGKVFVFLKWLLGTRVFDWMITRALKR
tara:strand:+ start:980 stop:1816 length:837 start_codon:yes stop_codon:yes gene_type:complete